MATPAIEHSAWRDITETLWPRAATKEDRLPPLLIVLTVVTGVVDALAYLRLGHVFVANMTGNVVFLGFAAAGAGGLSVPGSLLALAFFLGGGIAAGRFAGRLGADRRRQLSVAAAAEVALCAVATAVAGIAGQHLGTGSRYALIAFLALAMGVQNATARRLAVADLTTTVLTLTLTGIAADSWLGGGSGPRTARRVLAVIAMVLGALLGALLLLRVAPVAPLVLALALLAVVAVAARRGGAAVT
ncbi:MAG TPA: YoaK family protein [Gaiellaceae bacterium]